MQELYGRSKGSTVFPGDILATFLAGGMEQVDHPDNFYRIEIS